MSAIINAETRSQALEAYRQQRSLIKGQIMPEGATDAEFDLFVEVAAQYGLNPLNGEIWAIRGKGAKDKPGPIKPRVGYEGYYRKAQEHPDFEWMAVECWYENDKVEINLGNGEVSHIPAMGDQGKLIGCWVQVKKRSRPQPFVRRYFLEQMRPPVRKSKDGYTITTPWDTNPVQMLVGSSTRLTLKALFSLYLPPDDFEAEFSDDEDPKAQLPKRGAKAIEPKAEEPKAIEASVPTAEQAVEALDAAVEAEKSKRDATISPVDTSDSVEPHDLGASTRDATSDLAEGPQDVGESQSPDVSSTSAAPKPTYWHHTESSDVFIVEDGSNPMESDQHCIELTFEEYEHLKAMYEQSAKASAPTIGLGFDKDDLMINREKAEIDTDAALAVLGFPQIDHPTAYATIIPKVAGVQEPLVPQDLPDEAFAKFGKWVRKVARNEWTVPPVIAEYILAQSQVEAAPVDDSDPLAADEDAPKRGRGRPAKKDVPASEGAPAKEDGQGEEKPTSSSSDGSSTKAQSASGSQTVSAIIAPADDEYDPFTDPEMAELVQEYKDANARELEALKYLQERGISSAYMVSLRKGPHWVECALRHRDNKLPETGNALVSWIIVEGMALKKAEVAS